AEELLFNVALEGIFKELEVVLDEFGELGLRQDGLPVGFLVVARGAARGQQANAHAQDRQAEAHGTCPSHLSHLLVWPAAPAARAAGLGLKTDSLAPASREKVQLFSRKTPWHCVQDVLSLIVALWTASASPFRVASASSIAASRMLSDHSFQSA